MNCGGYRRTGIDEENCAKRERGMTNEICDTFVEAGRRYSI